MFILGEKIVGFEENNGGWSGWVGEGVVTVASLF